MRSAASILSKEGDSSAIPSRSAGSLRTVAEIAELAGGLAHELRNPLSTMMINLKLLSEELEDMDARPEDVRRRSLLKVDVLRREAERLQRLFDEFLNLAGPCRLEPTDVDLNEVVRRLVEFLRPLIDDKGINVSVEPGEGMVTCWADEKLLDQALLNIVINAQEAMPDGGDLRIWTGIDGDDAFIAVSDTGTGIDERDRQRILRPFFSTKATGSGLGLSITQRIVHEHGGTMSLESERSKGTTFTIRLPRRPGRAVSAEEIRCDAD